MQKLLVNEIFYSLQGEGIRFGTASIFIRLTGCNLKCHFCDTEFTSGDYMTLPEIAGSISKYNCADIVWTGGEPAQQLTPDIISYFKELGYYQCIETNGTIDISNLNIDFITLSPKVAEHIIFRNFKNLEVDEIKYIIYSGKMNVPETKIKAKNYYLSPAFDGDNMNLLNLNHCIKLILKNSKWKLTTQMHKIWKIK